MIAIDAGHGGADHGCTGGGLREKDLTLSLAKRIHARATALGIKTALIRDSDVKMRLSDRGKAAARLRAVQALCLHFDSSPQPSVGRTTFYVQANDCVSRQLAESIGKRVPRQLAEKVVVIATSPNDWRARAHNVVCAYAPMPALLIEWGFLSNPRHVAYITTRLGFESMAEATVAGVMKKQERNSTR